MAVYVYLCYGNHFLEVNWCLTLFFLFFFYFSWLNCCYCERSDPWGSVGTFVSSSFAKNPGIIAISIARTAPTIAPTATPPIPLLMPKNKAAQNTTCPRICTRAFCQKGIFTRSLVPQFLQCVVNGQMAKDLAQKGIRRALHLGHISVIDISSLRMFAESSLQSRTQTNRRRTLCRQGGNN